MPAVAAESIAHVQSEYILTFDQIGRDSLPIVGGKGANLGVLTAAGFPVPPGFCVTTQAFDHFMAEQAASIYAVLEPLDPGDVDAVRVIGEQVRQQLHAAPIPPPVADAIVQAWQALGSDHAYAVRSSATAEDLPDASFAGQQDTYLNVRGPEELLERVRRCWASLFTDRAILYRMQQGFEHRDVRLAVVIQRMIQPDVSGIMFTAEPVSGHRQTVAIDASYGLGEALVSGLVSADLYHVDSASARILKRQIADKRIEIRSLTGGGVEHRAVADADRHRPALTDSQVLALAALGTRIERHYGRPQDIEWALVDGKFFILQARPITSLYPLPQPAPADSALHVYMSFNHVQVMTDAMPDLSISLWQLIFPFGRTNGSRFNSLMAGAGGRAYVDVSPLLRHPILKRIFPAALSNADQMAAEAIRQLIARPDFQAPGPVAKTRRIARWMLPLLGRLIALGLWRNPDGVAEEKTAFIHNYSARLKRTLAVLPTPAARLNHMVDTLYNAFYKTVWAWAPYPLVGMLAYGLLGNIARRLIPDHQVAAISRGLHGNVTTEMDLAVGDLADLLRNAPLLMSHLRRTDQSARQLLESAGEIGDGREFMHAWAEFVSRYGMRGPSEIDPSRLRWAEDPGSLLQMVLGNAQHSEHGTHRLHHRRMAQEGDVASAQLQTAAARGMLGYVRGPLVRRLIRLVRNLVPLREHPKFLLVHLIWLFKQTVLECGASLVEQGRLNRIDDVWFLTLPELQTAMAHANGLPLVDERRAAFQRHQKLQPPRVMTSHGEILTVSLSNANAPDGALVGSPVSSGVIEGIAHVIRDPQTEMLNPGEILVAPFTDPGWTPLFINASGLVMEVGGLMTHGSVIAREYGIPAVVGVAGATTQIKTGQRLRVHGDSGYVEILAETAAGV